MKILTAKITVLFVLFFSNPCLENLPVRIEKKIDKEISAIFKISSFQKESLEISDSINSTLPVEIADCNFNAINSESSNLGYFYFGQAYGKAAYFDFIIVFDNELNVLKINMITYREDHGGEIGSKRWLKQFIGKSKTSNVTYEDDIAAISGATISAKSLINEVNKVLKTINILNQKNLL